MNPQVNGTHIFVCTGSSPLDYAKKKKKTHSKKWTRRPKKITLASVLGNETAVEWTILSMASLGQAPSGGEHPAGSGFDFIT